MNNEKIVLKKYTSEDKADFCQLMTNGSVMQFVDGVLSEEKAEHLFSDFTNSKNEYVWAVRNNSDNTYIGHAGFETTKELESLEILFYLLPDYWGKGIATEVGHKLVGKAESIGDIQSIVATLDIDHQASIKVCEKIGMQFKEKGADADGDYLIYCKSLLTTRKKLINDISLKIMKMERDKPLKIAVDGITASGKTTFSNELAESLSSLGADVHRASLDGFHNPKAIRHRKGRKSPEGYYFDAYNYDAIVRHMLEPLCSGINPKYRTQVFDLQNDQKSFSDEISIDSDSIFIVDGSFSLRDELYKYWDFSIYLSVEMSRAQQRAEERDKELFKSAELAIETTRDRYHAAHSIHNKLEGPWKKASIVIDNNDPQNAFLINQSEFKQ